MLNFQKLVVSGKPPRFNNNGNNRSEQVLWVLTACYSYTFCSSHLVSELQPIQYLVEVFTADVNHAGTDANVFITLYGANGDTGQRQLTKKFVNLFERGQTDDFKIEALDLGQLTRLRIEHDNKGFGAGWMLDKVVVTNLTSQEKVTFSCGQWLDKKKGDGKICRDLLPLPS